MKLRNKKTGEIVNAMFYAPVGGYELSIWKDTDYLDPTSDNHRLGVYKSLTGLNEEWEDYKPAEPLIKDEKMRKAVRAWAEANAYSFVKIGFDMASEPNDGYVQIHFEGSDIVDEDKYGVHTIAELCGEDV